MIVRDAEQRDLDQLLEVYAEADFGRGTGDVEQPRAALRRILGDEAHRICVLVEDGAVLGAADLVLVDNLTHGGRPWAIVENVAVRTSARSQGAGTLLIEHLLEVARDHGCYKVQLLSGKQRTDAHRFYGRLGFEPVAEGFKIYLDGT